MLSFLSPPGAEVALIFSSVLPLTLPDPRPISLLCHFPDNAIKLGTSGPNLTSIYLVFYSLNSPFRSKFYHLSKNGYPNKTFLFLINRFVEIIITIPGSKNLIY